MSVKMHTIMGIQVLLIYACVCVCATCKVPILTI